MTNETQVVEQVPNVLLIELINQQPSNFVLDGGNEESELPTNISAPNARKIKNTSKIAYIVPKGQPDAGMKKLRPIRYISGCDLIYVDEQEKAGYKPNPAADVIWILNGKLTVLESGSDIGKYRFLRAHEGNVDNPNRPDNAIGIFCEINTAIEAVETENIFDEEIKVLNYLNTLKTKVRENEYTYNEDAIAFLCDLFKLPPFGTGFKSEAWVGLAVTAKADPKKFLKSITKLVAIIEGEVNNALANGIIALDEEKAYFVESNMVITHLNPKSDSDEKKDELVDFFANPANRNHYDKLRSEIHKKKVGQAAIVD